MKRNEQQPFPKAACRNHPYLHPDEWSPDGNTLSHGNRQAIDTCNTCHHQTDCALLGRLGSEYGIWGGLFLDHGTLVRPKKTGTRGNLPRVA